MLTTGDFIRIAMRRKGFTQQNIVNRINKLGLADGKEFHRQHLSNYLNGISPLTVFVARKLEIVMGLQEYTLVDMIDDNLTEKEIKKLGEIEEKARKAIEELKNGKKEEKQSILQ